MLTYTRFGRYVYMVGGNREAVGVPDRVAVLVIAAREDVEIARQTRALLG